MAEISTLKHCFSVTMQVHASRVAALAFCAEGNTLWSGCDAAAPRPGPEDVAGSEEPPVALVSCKASTGGLRYTVSAVNKSADQLCCVEEHVR